MSHFDLWTQVRALFKAGWDTAEIAELQQRPEAFVYNDLHHQAPLREQPIAYAGKDRNERPLRSLAATTPAHTSARGGPDSTEDATPRSDPRSSINSISSPGHEGNREEAGAAVAGVGNSERGTS